MAPLASPTCRFPRCGHGWRRTTGCNLVRSVHAALDSGACATKRALGPINHPRLGRCALQTPKVFGNATRRSSSACLAGRRVPSLVGPERVLWALAMRQNTETQNQDYCEPIPAVRVATKHRGSDSPYHIWTFNQSALPHVVVDYTVPFDTEHPHEQVVWCGQPAVNRYAPRGAALTGRQTPASRRMVAGSPPMPRLYHMLRFWQGSARTHVTCV